MVDVKYKMSILLFLMFELDCLDRCMCQLLACVLSYEFLGYIE